MVDTSLTTAPGYVIARDEDECTGGVSAFESSIDLNKKYLFYIKVIISCLASAIVIIGMSKLSKHYLYDPFHIFQHFGQIRYQKASKLVKLTGVEQ
uniref:CASP-like protein n=1 Tax=Romanomermis culicivorax TaxID=13658 RepID=A0A915KAG7_ROMCU